MEVRKSTIMQKRASLTAPELLKESEESEVVPEATAAIEMTG